MLRKIPILMYHRVAEITPEEEIYPGMTMPPAQFEDQMRYLAQQGYTTLTMNEVLQVHLGQLRGPKKAVAITFDDGYQDNFEVAWPILKRYGLSATFFVVVGQLGKNNNWNLPRPGISAPPLMTVEEARQMLAEGATFGSHTLEHVALPDLPQGEAKRQIQESRQLLGELLGSPAAFFSYPYDRVTPEVARMVEESGYKGACGPSALPEGRFNLWRIECFSYDSRALFRLKVSGYYHLFQWLRHQSGFAKWLRKLWGK